MIWNTLRVYYNVSFSPAELTVHSAPLPQGLGRQGSGFLTQRLDLQYLCWNKETQDVINLAEETGSRKGAKQSRCKSDLHWKPILQSGSLWHSGLHPVIVSGLGENPS